MVLRTALIKVYKLPHILSGFGCLANDDIGEVNPSHDSLPYLSRAAVVVAMGWSPWLQTLPTEITATLAFHTIK